MSYKIVRKNRGDMPFQYYQFCGYPMSSKAKYFVIEEEHIKNIIVMDYSMISSLISKKVKAKYRRLIKILTELLVSSDDDGTSCREALNLIEKFRLEIKNKYRNYLTEKELKEMSRQLKIMKQVAFQREAEIKTFLKEEYISRSK